MKAAPTPWQVVATMITCGLAGLVMGHPAELPAPLRLPVQRAVDYAARVWLWTWDEPAGALDDSFQPWGEPDLVAAPLAVPVGLDHP